MVLNDYEESDSGTNQIMLSDSLDTIISKQIANHSISGVVIAVEEKGRVMFRKAYGDAVSSSQDHLLQQGVPMTVDHIFDLASLTKVFATTFAIMLLVDRGDVELNESVSHYLKAFDKPDKNTITVRNLLNHTSGLLEWFPLYLYVSSSGSAIDFMGEMLLQYEIGEGRHYSDLGFMVLGQLVKVISGQSMDIFLDKNLFQPLGFKSTYFRKVHCDGQFAATSVGNPFEKNMIANNTYANIPAADLESFDGWREYLLQGEVNDMNAHYVFDGVAGHSGLFSTVNDLLILSRLVLNKGSLNGTEYLRRSTVNQFITEDQYGNGLGWAMDGDTIMVSEAPPGTIGHIGFTGTSVVLVPARQISIVLLTNRQQGGLDSNGNYSDINPPRYEINRTVITCL